MRNVLVHSTPPQKSNISEPPSEYQQNQYLLEKIKEAENDPDTRLRTHDEVWQPLGKKYGI